MLILHQYFNTPQTGGPLRSYYLARALVNAGHTVAVITTHNEPGARKETVEGIKVHYIPIPYHNRFGFGKRVSSFLAFVLSIVKEAGRFKEYHICYAISTPLTIGLAARWIKWRYGIPYLFEVGDLWPEAPIQVGVIKNPALKIILYRLERSIYKRAQSIVALSQPIKAAIERKVNKPIHVIPNMADTTFYKPAAKNPALESQFGVAGKFVLSYIGTFGVANGLQRILQCAQEAQRNNLPTHFILCGDGAQLDELQYHIAHCALTNVSIIPMQDRAGVEKVLNVTDAAFISYLPLPVLETGSPNKYFDALAAGKMIVVNFGGWIKTEIETHACGVFTGTPGMFVEKIKPFIEQPEQLWKYQQHSRALAELTYSRKLVTSKFVSTIVG